MLFSDECFKIVVTMYNSSHINVLYSFINCITGKRFDDVIFIVWFFCLIGHLGEVWCLSVSPNGKWVVTAGKDRTVRLWEKER
jgi:WD40 repeat protein